MGYAMPKGFVKTASGTVLKDTSPAAIEEFLVRITKDALGEWKDAVKIRPYLEVEEVASDLNNNVKSGFGAMQLDVYGVKLFLPFIIVDKKLLPFDTIRMGEQEVSYDHSKLQRLVNAIEHKAKEKQNSDSSYETMEVADFDDIQYNNGFLGTIMQIRDNHRNRDARSNDDFRSTGFGNISEERMMRYASEMDVMNGFHDVMEKIAKTRTFTPSQLDAYEQHILKEAKKESLEDFEKLAAEETETMDTAKLKRDMMKLDEEKLFNVHRAASGNNIAFPLFEENRVEFRSGRVYRNFESWYKNVPNYSPGRIGALVLDSTGGYSILKQNDPFMASTKEPDFVELPTIQAKSLEAGPLYTMEKDPSTVYTPFVVERSWTKDRAEEGILLYTREKGRDLVNRSRYSNFIISEVFQCQEITPGKYTNDRYSFHGEKFTIVISKDPNVRGPRSMTRQEMEQYFTEIASDPSEALLAQEMLYFYTKDYILLPESYPLFKAEKNIAGFYTRPDGLFKQGPLSKTASYEGQNKATLIVQKDRNPKTYAVKWTFTKADKTQNGTAATSLASRYQEGLSKEQALALLGKLGFDHRTQAQFFEITGRNGRSATFRLPQSGGAFTADPNDKAESKVKQKMKSIANSMLHSQNFMPLMEDTISNGASAALALTVPSSVDAVHKVSDFFSTKQAAETAIELEKLATKLGGASWHELAALVNMKHRIDKVASEAFKGNYVANGKEVFEKVAEFQPTIEKKASDLIEFNRKQLINTDSYLIKPSLVKQALEQLDGLYKYAFFWNKKKEESKPKPAVVDQTQWRDLGPVDPSDEKPFLNRLKATEKLYRDAHKKGHLTQDGLWEIDILDADSDAPFQNISSRHFKPEVADSYINRFDTEIYPGNPDSLKKQAAFFNGANKKKFNELTDTLGVLKKKVEQSTSEMADKQLNVNTLIREGVDEQTLNRALSEAQAAEAAAHSDLAAFSQLSKERGELNQSIAKNNLIGAAAVGLPSLGGLAYFNEHQKDKRGLR